jgi:hypothetical protein
VAIDRRAGQRRQVQRRKVNKGILWGTKVGIMGPRIMPAEEHPVDSLKIGRRRWEKQTVWPKEIERRNYDPKMVNLIWAKNVNIMKIKPGDRVTTTRRGLRSVFGVVDKYVGDLGDRRGEERRKNKKLARQITKDSKK